jgi:hypothetical protein
MSSSEQTRPLLDQAALALQALRVGGRLRSDVLLRIDNTTEAAAAPYQFDAAAGRLHRLGCRAIPDGAPLYGRWHIGSDDLTVACKRCRPLQDETKPDEPTERADLLLGVLSLVTQFSGVLKERGKDYQKTDEGQALTAQLGAIYRNLGRREKEILDAMLGTLDTVIERLRALDRELSKNGNKNGAEEGD